MTKVHLSDVFLLSWNIFSRKDNEFFSTFLLITFHYWQRCCPERSEIVNFFSEPSCRSVSPANSIWWRTEIVYRIPAWCSGFSLSCGHIYKYPFPYCLFLNCDDWYLLPSIERVKSNKACLSHETLPNAISSQSFQDEAPTELPPPRLPGSLHDTLIWFSIQSLPWKSMTILCQHFFINCFLFQTLDLPLLVWLLI